mmetsp:Transcript_100837/g.310949  ORF Transcript_100837/g.310949 Transcript_100837/m.310949 type:complete len:530 (-) Transcript_100837:43-1632(-)
MAAAALTVEKARASALPQGHTRDQPQQQQQQQQQQKSARMPQQPWQAQQRKPQHGGNFVPRRLCNRWLESGWCWKADSCTFAHGPEELHPDVREVVETQLAGGARDGQKFPAGRKGCLRAGAPEFTPAAQIVDGSLSEADADRPPAFVFSTDAAPFVLGATAGADSGFQLNADAPPFNMGEVGKRFKLNAGAEVFEPRLTSLAREAGKFELNADATPFQPTHPRLTGEEGTAEAASHTEPSTLDTLHSVVGSSEESASAETLSLAEDSSSGSSGETPQTPRRKLDSTLIEASAPAEAKAAEETPAASPQACAPVEPEAAVKAPSAPQRQPVLSLPGVEARKPPARTVNVAGVAGPSPDSPAAAAAMKFIRRNSALVPSSPLSQILLRQTRPVPALSLDPTAEEEEASLDSALGCCTLVELAAWAKSPSLEDVGSPQLGLQNPLTKSSPALLSPPPSPALPTAEDPIPRSVLLQAGLKLRDGLQGGAPGLSHCAPTPKSKARIVGFTLPEPGLISTQPVSAKPETCKEKQ